MTHQDNQGYPVTAASDEAVRNYDATLTEYLGFGQGTGVPLKAMLTADPEMPMAHVIKGCFFQLFAKRVLIPKAVAALEAAQAAREAHGSTAREALHITALKAWLDEDLAGALAAWEEILSEHPRDALALRLAHYMHFYLQPGPAMRESVKRVLGDWGEDAPNYGFVQGVAAFAHEEAGDYEAAEAFGRKAVESNPADIWAVHAVAHVMEMQGRHKEGIDWIKGLEPHWTTTNNFRYHVWWHRALFHLERGEYDDVLALYDDHIRGEDPDSDDYLDLSNAIAMLWRLEALGVGPGERWAELAEKSAGRADDHQLVFADAHFVMALAAAGREEDAHALIGRMEAMARTSRATEAAVAAEVGIPLVRAIVAERAGNFAAAGDALAPVADAIPRIGGSAAQRDLFVQLLLHAQLKAGRFEAARVLTEARTAAKPTSGASWAWHAEALEGIGDGAGAAAARARSEALYAV